MSALEGIALGFSVLAQPENLLAAFIGVLVGTAIGVLPGLGPVAGAALVLPYTFTVGPTAGAILIAGIYVGAMYGGSTTAVLLNIPGETASIVAAIDGHKMAQQGRAGVALTVMAVGSFIAGTIAAALVTVLSPSLAAFSLQFGPAEFFALTAGGLIILARVSGGTLASSAFPLVLGVLLSTIGQEAVTGRFRFTLGLGELSQGIDITSAVVGLFGIAEIMILAEAVRAYRKPEPVPLRSLLPTRRDWRRAWAPWGRGTGIGFFFGLLPGPSGTLGSFVSYRFEKLVSKNKKELGHGAVEGIAAPEAANNAAATSGLVPVLSLGIPFSATFALMLAALVVQGVQPGPLLIVQHPEIFWGLLASLYLGNIMLVILNVPLVGLWVRVLTVPLHYLIPAILLFGLIGSFSARNSIFDLYLLTAAGILGYLLRKLGFQLAPLVLGLILGPFIEKYLRQSLFLSRGELDILWESAISRTVWTVAVLTLVIGAVKAILGRTRSRSAAQPEDVGEPV